MRSRLCAKFTNILRAIRLQNAWAMPAVAVAALLITASLNAGRVFARGPNLQSAYEEISTELASPQTADTGRAVAAIDGIIEKDAFQCRLLLRDRWLPILMAKKQYSAVARLTKQEILLIPRRTPTIQRLLTLRVQALLAMNHPNQALPCAKTLFNFCALRDTANALKLMARCLAAASPDGDTEVDRLKREQIAGAGFVLAPAVPKTCPVLAAIKTHGTAYSRRAWSITSQRYVNVIERGNLLLLADQPKEAMACFHAAYLAANAPSEWAEAAGRIAACMKAEDGTIGRANSWAWSLRQR
jgi:hypothetical protein